MMTNKSLDISLFRMNNSNNIKSNDASRQINEYVDECLCQCSSRENDARKKLQASSVANKSTEN